MTGLYMHMQQTEKILSSTVATPVNIEVYEKNMSGLFIVPVHVDPLFGGFKVHCSCQQFTLWQVYMLLPN